MKLKWKAQSQVILGMYLYPDSENRHESNKLQQQKELHANISNEHRWKKSSTSSKTNHQMTLHHDQLCFSPELLYLYSQTTLQTKINKW